MHLTKDFLDTCEQATKLRHDDPKETRNARRLAEKHSVKEAQVSPDNSGEFRAWVSEYGEPLPMCEHP